MTPRARLLPCALLMLAAWPELAVAQADSATQCGRARQILSERRIEPEDGPALAIIYQCAGAGGALAAAWSHPPADSSMLAWLVASSARVADRRILDATLSLVQTGPSVTQRRAALEVVLAQFDPSFTVSQYMWVVPDSMSLPRESDYYQRPGEQPPTASDRQRIVDTFRQLSTADPDPSWRGVARLIVRGLAPRL